MLFKKIFLFFFFICTINGFAQIPELSPLSKISVLTSGAGDVLYSAFGHSAIRVQDPTLGIDVVYNYGVFDTSGENFYVKFSQGRMDYKLVREGFRSYFADYKIQNRWVKEQQLNLSVQEKNKLFGFLEKNNLPENKIYQYDYFLNNCATKIWDILKENYGENLTFKENYIKDHYTFRELIHHNIKINSWGAFGIDLALGSVIDRKATPKEHLYLPIYVLYQLNAAQLNNAPLAAKEVSLYKSHPVEAESNFFTSPLFFTLAISILILIITYFDFKKKKRNRWLDFGIFLFTGLAGTLLFFLWFLTDHIWTVGNYNILWAFPLNLIFAFFILRRKIPIWTRKYPLILLGLLLILIVLWVLKVQTFTPVLIPLLIALAARHLFLHHHFKQPIQ